MALGRSERGVEGAALRQPRVAETAPSAIVPVLIGLLVLTAAILVGAEYRASENRALEEASGAALRRVTSQVGGRIEDQIQALERLARRWELRGGLSRTDWELDARQLVRDFRHMQAVEWIDASFRVRWIVPLEGNEAALDLDLAFEERRRSALEDARDRRAVTLTRPVDLV